MEVVEILIKMSNIEGVMVEVEEIMLQYNIIVRFCSVVFVVFEQLYYINYFYQFLLQYFLDIFYLVLYGNLYLEGEQNYNVRRDFIVKDFFVVVFK